MSAGHVFLIRAAGSLGAAFILGYFYFGGLDWVKTILLAGFLLGAAYVFETFRRWTRKD